MTEATVNRIVNALQEEGRIGDAPRHSHCKTTEGEDRAPVVAACNNPILTVGKIKNSVSLDGSDELVRRRLQEAGVWGVVTKDGLGLQHRIPGRCCAEYYTTVIHQTHLPHLLDGPFENGCFLLQQNLSPVHKARSVKSHLEQLGVMILDWPPRGADLNIIAN
ncbi:hypothetical protein HPB47_010504, partial [Ixodes persulcatus]